MPAVNREYRNLRAVWCHHTLALFDRTECLGIEVDRPPDIAHRQERIELSHEAILIPGGAACQERPGG